MKYNILFWMMGLGLLVGCEDGDKQISAQRSTQIQNISQYGILPLHRDFEDACKALLGTVKYFEKTPNANTLQAAKKQWIVVNRLIKRCEFYDVGEVNGSFIHPRIYRWPSNVERIEKTIQETDHFDSTVIENLGSNLIGIAALEYLLFQNDEASTIAQFKETPKRLAYLVSISSYLVKEATALHETWKKFSPKFEKALDSDMSGAQNLLANGLIRQLEKTTKTSIGKALGEANGGKADKSKLEAPISQISIDLLRNTLKECKLVFTGDFTNSPNHYGFDDYTAALGNKALADKILKSIDSCEQQIARIDNLGEVLDNNPAQVKALREELNELIVLVKADLASQIGVSITISDADGD